MVRSPLTFTTMCCSLKMKRKFVPEDGQADGQWREHRTIASNLIIISWLWLLTLPFLWLEIRKMHPQRSTAARLTLQTLRLAWHRFMRVTAATALLPSLTGLPSQFGIIHVRPLFVCLSVCPFVPTFYCCSPLCRRLFKPRPSLASFSVCARAFTLIAQKRSHIKIKCTVRWRECVPEWMGNLTFTVFLSCKSDEKGGWECWWWSLRVQLALISRGQVCRGIESLVVCTELHC